MPGLKTQIIFFGFLIVLLIFVIKIFFPVQTVRPQSPEEIKANHVPDASELACMDFYLLVKDMQKGILTVEEMREKAKHIQETAEASHSSDLTQAGDDLLAAFTIGKSPDVGRALKAMSKACKQQSP